MSGENRFPEELNEPDRGRRLIREFYQDYADITKTPNYYTEIGPQHETTKTAFYRRWLEKNGHDQRSLGLDVGCRGGVLAGMVGLIRWIGVDIDDADWKSRGGLVLPVRKWILLPPSTFKMQASMS